VPEAPGREIAVSILADGFPDAGLGHLSRSSAIATALACRGVSVTRLALGADAPLERDGAQWSPWSLDDSSPPGRVVVVDSYTLNTDDLVRLAASRPLVVLHDATESPPEAALVVSVAAEPTPDGRLLAGLEYAALRPDFWGLPRREIRGDVEHILVTTGSGTFGGFAGDLARDVANAAPYARVTLVHGPHATEEAPPGVEAMKALGSLLQPLLETDLVVCAGGQTMLEAVATGAPCVALPVVANQRPQLERLARAQAVVMLDPSSDDRAAAIDRLATNPEARLQLSKNAQQAVDGYGAHRVAFHVARLVEASR
jgi:spore coat polysaccharide biosynthesis predicted glycosyltransferase SpsG